MTSAFLWLLRAAGVALLACLFGCTDGPTREVLRGSTMGTTWSVIYAANDNADRELLNKQMTRELESINQSLSTYIRESEISRLNAMPDQTPVELSDHFSLVLSEALDISEVTAGAYDVTVGPLVDLWGFGPGEFTDAVPSSAAIRGALARVGSGKLRWQPDSKQLSRPPGVRVDMSSIAKGYAVDRLTEILREQGIDSALVEIGGELRAIGGRPEGGAWRLAVESPEPSEGRFIEALNVENMAVATSGDYRNYFEVDGVRYSHLVDPRTGYPVTHELVSVTVVDANCMRADALATALIVLGLDDAMALAERLDLAAYFVSRSAEQLEVHYTSSFGVYLHRAADSTGS